MSKRPEIHVWYNSDLTPYAAISLDGSLQTVSYNELVKYIRERELVANNSTVRSLWDRYQVAVKLVGSKDHG